MLFNPFAPGFRADPYPSYHRLRSTEPVHFMRFPGVWVVTRWVDVMAVLRDDDRFTAARPVAGRPKPDSALAHIWQHTMLVRDPPDHTRLRTLVMNAFQPRAVEALRPHIRRLVDELLDAIAPDGAFDVVAALAEPLPVIVIAELLGVPPEDRALLKRWSDGLAVTVDGTVATTGLDHAEACAVELREYFTRIFAARRAAPREDLVSALLAAHESDDVLSEDELIATCFLLLTAGDETTTNLIGNGTLALLRNPDELARLQTDPRLLRSAVDEILRFDSPVQFTSRIARVDVELGGQHIRAGQELMLGLGAANRDPAQFPDPDRLDVGRKDVRHLSFSHGIHFCLGAPLGRAEGQIALEVLFGRFPQLRLDGEPTWRESIVLRGPSALPVAVGPPKAA